MFLPIEEYRKLRKKYNHQMFTSGVGVFRAFEEAEAQALKDGALDQKTKELIALASSIVTLCYGCVEYHTSAAMAHGATRQEVAETAAVALMIGGGPAQWPARYAFQVMDELEQQPEK